MRIRSLACTLLVGLTLAASSAASLAQNQTLLNPEVRRLGSGPSRTAQNALELKPISPDAWSALSNWTNGDALTADVIKGKVVLIVTWSAWNPSAKRDMNFLQGLASRFADKGLIVIAAHNAQHWDLATKFIADNKTTLPVALDAEGKFRAAVKNDADPSYTLVDRAGQLRFVNIDPNSIDAAATLLTAETPETAAGAPKALAEAQAKSKDAQGKTRTVNSAAAIAKLNIKPPTEDQYAKAPWPAKNPTDKVGGSDMQGQRLPNYESFGQTEIWLTPRPNWLAAVLVLEFWAPSNSDSKRAQPLLDDLALKNPDDLVVIGIIKKEEKQDQKTFERFVREHPPVFSQLLDEKGTAAGTLSPSSLPYCVVVSSDGIIRWQGSPLSTDFRSAVEAVLTLDPGARIRRQAIEATRSAP